MTPHAEHELSGLLRRSGAGDASAGDRLVRALYEPLKCAARSAFRGQRRDHTLQPTILVHEACLRLLLRPDADGVPCDDAAVAPPDGERAARRPLRPSFTDVEHFLAAASVTMKRLLVDHARRRSALRRGGACRAARIDEEHAAAHPARRQRESHEVTATLSRLIAELERRDARRGELARLHLLCGLSLTDVGAALGLARSTISLEWRLARAWLAARLEAEPAAPCARPGIEGSS